MRTDETRTTRRRLLAVSAAGLAGVTAGCLGDDSDDSMEVDTPEEDAGEPLDVADSVPETPRVEDPPDVVYKPTHRSAMRHLGSKEAGEYTVGSMVTYPHQFWTVTGTNTQVVRPDGRGLHLMVTVWDSASETVLPVGIGTEMRTLRDGETIDIRSPWPMISQPMGFHFGDNIPLPEDGAYTIELDLNPMTTRRTGDFAGRFETEGSVRFDFEYDRELRREIVDGVEYLSEDSWGEPGAIEPMGGLVTGEHSGDSGMSGQSDNQSMNGTGGQTETNGTSGQGGTSESGGQASMAGSGTPYSALPPAESYPGQRLGRYESGDARFVVRYFEGSRLSEDGGNYLLVSPRTPYNNVPLADMALTARGAVEGELVQTVDSKLGHHYGLSATLSPGDSVELRVDSPPQVARHRGYETAFIEMEPLTIEIPE